MHCSFYVGPFSTAAEMRRNQILISGKTVMPSLMLPTPIVLSLMLHSMMCSQPLRTEFHAKVNISHFLQIPC
ncbi:hypothetical protein AAZX31_04G204900 [Glycine max]